MIYVKKENMNIRAKLLSQTDTEVCLVSDDGRRKGTMSKSAFEAMYVTLEEAERLEAENKTKISKQKEEK